MALINNLSLQGKLTENASLKSHNSWKVGGNAEILFVPKDIADLAKFIKGIDNDVPLFWLGLGSNVLIRDGGINGAVIVTQGGLSDLSIVDEENFIVRAEAGVSCAKLARYTSRLGLTGLEFMAGIPGTVGGALAMNAGCYGGETWNAVQEVEMINRSGEIIKKSTDSFDISYRSVLKNPEEWFVAGNFKLKKGEKTRSIENIRVLLEKRNASQPTGLPNCGSVFRNPEGDFAAKLIEACGLKGHKLGGAAISTKHANFIINEGSASAKDIESLISHIIKKVDETHGLRLVPEVCFVGKK